MKKITLKEVRTILKEYDFTDINLVEEAEFFYKKLKWLPYEKAKEELMDFVYEDEVYVDVYLADDEIDRNKASEALQKIEKELSIYYIEFTNAQIGEFGESIFTSARPMLPLSKDREKYIEEHFLEPISKVLSKYEDIFYYSVT